MYLMASTEPPVFETSSIIAFCKQHLREESCLTHTNLLPLASSLWPCALPGHLYLQNVSARILGSVSSSKEALVNWTLL